MPSYDEIMSKNSLLSVNDAYDLQKDGKRVLRLPINYTVYDIFLLSDQNGIYALRSEIKS